MGRNRSPFNRNLTVRKGQDTRKKGQRVSREALRFDKHRNDRVTCLARLNYAPRGPATGITPALCQDVSATGWQNESPNDLSNHRGRPTAKNYQQKREVKRKRRERGKGKKGEKDGKERKRRKEKQMGKRKWQVKRKNGKEKEEKTWKRKIERKREKEGFAEGCNFRGSHFSPSPAPAYRYIRGNRVSSFPRSGSSSSGHLLRVYTVRFELTSMLTERLLVQRSPAGAACFYL